MISKLTSKSRIAAMVALGALLFGGMLATTGNAASRYGSQGVYQYGGNDYIIRKIKSGSRLYLRLYRLAGDQWEEQGGTSIPLNRAGKHARGPYRSYIERIYYTGRYRGPINIDLDNPLNTSLNRGGSGRID